MKNSLFDFCKILFINLLLIASVMFTSEKYTIFIVIFSWIWLFFLWKIFWSKTYAEVRKLLIFLGCLILWCEAIMLLFIYPYSNNYFDKYLWVFSAIQIFSSASIFVISVVFTYKNKLTYRRWACIILSVLVTIFVALFYFVAGF